MGTRIWEGYVTAYPSPIGKAKGRYVSDEEMKDFLRMRLQPAMSQELPSIQRRKELREAFDLSRKELAEQMGVSLAAIGAWETGRNEPRGEARNKYLAFCRAAEEILKEREVETGGNRDEER